MVSSAAGSTIGSTAGAAIWMVLAGALHVVQGVVALVDDTFFVRVDDYMYKFDVTTWGWIHLTVGVVVLTAGIALFRAPTWARVVAVAFASASILVSFAWLPFSPLWSMTVIVIDLLVLWAVTGGRDLGTHA